MQVLLAQKLYMCIHRRAGLSDCPKGIEEDQATGPPDLVQQHSHIWLELL